MRKRAKTYGQTGSGLTYEEQQIKTKPQLNIALRPSVLRHRLSQTQATDDYK
jgi:hypothetical protein